MKVVQFYLDDQAFALAVDSVREVQRLVAITTVVGLPAEILGVITVHGLIVPVLDLRMRLGLPAASQAATPASALLIVHCRKHILALLADHVQGVLTFADSIANRVADKPEVAWDCVRGLFRADDQLITVLDADMLLTLALEPLLLMQSSEIERR